MDMEMETTEYSYEDIEEEDEDEVASVASEEIEGAAEQRDEFMSEMHSSSWISLKTPTTWPQSQRRHVPHSAITEINGSLTVENEEDVGGEENGDPEQDNQGDEPPINEENGDPEEETEQDNQGDEPPIDEENGDPEEKTKQDNQDELPNDENEENTEQSNNKEHMTIRTDVRVQARPFSENGEATCTDFVVDIDGPDHVPSLEASVALICRVPPCIRELHESAYTPALVAIGPFHHGKQGLQGGQVHKERFQHYLLSCSNLDLNSLKVAMRNLEVETRRCYSEGFQEIRSDDFVTMMVLDACFVVQLLRLCTTNSLQGERIEKDEIFKTRWMIPKLRHELLKQENQLPLFVLEKVFSLTKSSGETQTLKELALKFFEPLRPRQDAMPDRGSRATNKYSHLLDLFRSSLIEEEVPNTSVDECRPPTSNRKGKNRSKGEPLSIPSKRWVRNAKSLRNAGISIRKKSGAGGRPLDIVFKGRKLLIPVMPIEDNTKFVLKTMIAYEQCNRDLAPYYATLAVFFSNLASSKEDVVILRRSGIVLTPPESDQEIADLFCSLAKEIVFDIDSCCIILMQLEGIEKCYTSFWGRFRRANLAKAVAVAIVTICISTLGLILRWATGFNISFHRVRVL